MVTGEKKNSRKGAKTQRMREPERKKIIFDPLAPWRLGARMNYF